MVDPNSLFPTMVPPTADNAAPPTMLTGQPAEPQPKADRFFPTMKAAEPQSEEAKPTPARSEQAKPESGGLPDAVRELRENDQGRQMFSPQKTYEFDIPDDLLTTKEETSDDIPPEVKAAAVAELREMAADLGASGADVRMLIARARTSATATVQDVDAERMQASNQLAREFGSEQAANQALTDAKELLARDPRVRALVLNLGMGNDVPTIRTLAELARRERSKGRLK